MKPRLECSERYAEDFGDLRMTEAGVITQKQRRAPRLSQGRDGGSHGANLIGFRSCNLGGVLRHRRGATGKPPAHGAASIHENSIYPRANRAPPAEPWRIANDSQPGLLHRIHGQVASPVEQAGRSADELGLQSAGQLLQRGSIATSESLQQGLISIGCGIRSHGDVFSAGCGPCGHAGLDLAIGRSVRAE